MRQLLQRLFLTGTLIGLVGWWASEQQPPVALDSTQITRPVLSTQYSVPHRSPISLVSTQDTAIPVGPRPILPLAESTVTSPAGETARSDDPADLRDATPAIVPDVVYGHKAGMALTYDVIRPDDPNGAGVIFVVSGGWFSRYAPPEQVLRMSLLNKLHQAGYTLFLLRHGSAPQFKVPEAVDDVLLGVRHIRGHAAVFDIDPERLGICGASAGGHLSLMVGTRGDDGAGTGENGNGFSRDGGNRTGASPIDWRRSGNRVACVAVYFPPTDLRGMVGPNRNFPALDFDRQLADQVSPILHVSDDTAPVLLVHGTEDNLVPLRHSERIKAALDDAEVESELLILDGAGHGFRGRQAEQAETAVLDWFAQYLLPDQD